MTRPIRLAWMPVFLILLSPHVKAASMYTITDLGTLPGTTTSIATGINDLGQVVGYAGNYVSYTQNSADPYLTGLNPQSFLYSNGQLTQIGNPYSDQYGSLPTGVINNSGQVAAVNQFINNSGQVVSNFEPFQVPVTTTTNGVTTTTQISFSPVGINDSGQIAGNLTPLGMPSDAGIYLNGKFFDISRALGLTGDYTAVVAMSNNGSVLLSDLHANDTTTYLIYNPDGTTKTLAMGGPLMGLNDLGQVVGNGLLYSNGIVTPLTDLIPPSSQSFWTGLNPMAINDEGQIVGFGGQIGGPAHAFLMTPVTPTPAPEPSTLAVLTTAIASFSIRRWVRRSRRTK